MYKSEQERADWFFATFGERIEPAFEGTNITPDLVGALALQETGYMWNSFWKAGANTEQEFLEFCVGDTVSNRNYFPTSYNELMRASRGNEVFVSLRSALEKLQSARPSQNLNEYAENPQNILYGYGIFQYDLMFYEDYRDHDFYINKEWKDFDACLVRLRKVILQNMKKRNFSTTRELDHTGKIMASLLYHRGKVTKRPLFKQGYCENKGRGPCYGEKIDRYLRMSRQSLNRLDRGEDSSNRRTVAVRSGLNLRKGPGTEFEVTLTSSYGDVVFLTSEPDENNWVQVDLEGDGISDGYMFAEFLEA